MFRLSFASPPPSLLLCGLVACLFWPLTPVCAEVRISEVLAEDRRVLADEDGDHPGWIELHNAGPEPVALEGYGLSDDPERPFRWTLPDVSLAPGGRLVVYASGKDRRDPAAVADPAPAGLSPGELPGLQWWVDASDMGTLTVLDGQVSEWRDKSLRRPADEYPAPVTPQDLPGKVLWLDASAPGRTPPAEGWLNRWEDLSGNGRAAAQTDPGRQPRWLVGTNGLPRVRFDGDDDVLRFADEVTVQTLVWVGMESPDVAPTDRRPLVGHSAQFNYLRGTELALLGQHVAVPPAILGAAVYLNGRRVNPFTTPLPPGLNVVVIVGLGPAVFDSLADDRGLTRGRWWGEVSELIGFDRALTDSESVALDRHLRSKWQGAADQVAPDFSARQSHGDWRPRLASDPLTGLPAVRFDGTDDRLRFSEVKRARSIFMVVREHEHATDATRPFLGHSFSSALARGYDRLLMQVGNPRAWIDGVEVDPLLVRPPSRRFLLAVELPDPAPVDSLAQDPTYDDLLFEGDVYEVALFDRALEPAEREALGNWLSRKWQLPDRRLHANFSLKANGESLLLTRPDGAMADQAPELKGVPDRPVGRILDGEQWGWQSVATPGRANDVPAAAFGQTPIPLVFPAGGFLGATNRVTLAPGNGSPADTRIYFTLDGSEPEVLPGTPWLEDGLPPGAAIQRLNDAGWKWASAEPVPISGSRSLQSGRVSGLHQAVITFENPLAIGPDGQIYLELWCDPESPPRAVMVQVRAGGSWGHRAFWGDDVIELGTPGTAARRRLGELPAAGHWTRLSIPAGVIGLTKAEVSDLAFTLFDGRAAFDAVGGTGGPLPRIYQEPLELARSTVIRARAVAPGQLPSDPVTSSHLERPPGDLPVVSLSTAPADLFDEIRGLYVTGPARGADGEPRRPNYQRNWERPVHAELFEPDGTLGFALPCGLKIHGAFSRHWPQKSLRLHFRSRYGAGRLDYPVFPGHTVTRFDSLVLRNAGNDWNFAYLRDAFAHGVAADLGLGHQEARPAHLFLNGEYWGVHFLRERADGDSIARQNGLSDEDLDVIKNEVEVVGGDRSGYRTMIDLAVAAVIDPARQPQLAAQINVTNYWNWLALELFSGNVDWPGNNVLAWRDRRPGGLWNWSLLDCDGGFFSQTLPIDPFDDLLRTRALVGLPASSMVVMRGLLAETGHRQGFARRVGDLLNTSFSPESTLGRLAALEAALAPAMPAQIARWKDSASVAMPKGSAIQRTEQWAAAVGEVRDFLKRRPPAFREACRNFFGLGPDVALTVDANPAQAVRGLKVSTLEFSPDQLPWRGNYFSGLPVQVSVEPIPGYRVAGWSDGAPAGVTRIIDPGEVQNLTVLLVPDDSGGPPIFPQPHRMRSGPYEFAAWPSSAPSGTYPPAMTFETSAVEDPGLDAPASGWWTNRYDLDSRSRVIGADELGVSFVNTGNPQTAGDFVTGALMALDTVGMKDIDVTWTGGTVAANARNYALRLQWRRGADGPFADVESPDGSPVEYRRAETDGHSMVLGPVRLPAAAGGQAMIQLRWRYYSVPEPDDAGPRAQLRLDDIRVTGVSETTPPRCVALMESGSVVIRVTAAPGTPCVLQSSDDLRVWNDVAAGTINVGGSLNFSLNPPALHRFYQVRVP